MDEGNFCLGEMCKHMAKDVSVRNSEIQFNIKHNRKHGNMFTIGKTEDLRSKEVIK